MSTSTESPDAPKSRKVNRRTIIYICVFLVIVCIAAVYPLVLSHQKALEEEQEAAMSKVVKKTFDEAALHVAVMPTADCLPIYYASATGIYHQIGLNMDLQSYDSQLDCDTALIGHYADCGWADPERLQGKKMRQVAFTELGQGTEAWKILVCGTLRIKDVKSIDGRTIAIARNTVESRLLDGMIAGAGLKSERVFRPLINDLKLRAEMLTGNQIDAAMLRWPYAQLAQSMGHKVLAAAPSKPNLEARFVVKTEKAKEKGRGEQLNLLARGYAMAVDSIRAGHRDRVSQVLQLSYGIPKEVADTLQIPKLNKDFLKAEK